MAHGRARELRPWLRRLCRVLPSVEAISEFKVETLDAVGEYGIRRCRASQRGYEIGTRRLSRHGLGILSANDKWMRITIFTNLNGQPKPPLRFNVYGYNIGGPVFIPKLYPAEKVAHVLLLQR